MLPDLLDRWAVSAPMVLVGVGMLIGLTPLPDGLPLDPQDEPGAPSSTSPSSPCIVALMGVGLALDRPLELRGRSSWRAWAPTWRLLAIAMPLCIAGGRPARAGGPGLAPAAALLLGAALAPTDPVLASDVQVAGPQTGDHEVDETDEVRFTLTSEAGLNDGLAVPVRLRRDPAGDRGRGLGLVAGVGRAGTSSARSSSASVVGHRGRPGAGPRRVPVASRSLRVAERGESLLALAALVAAYGLGEVAGGYGFLSVFAAR